MHILSLGVPSTALIVQSASLRTTGVTVLAGPTGYVPPVLWPIPGTIPVSSRVLVVERYIARRLLGASTVTFVRPARGLASALAPREGGRRRRERIKQGTGAFDRIQRMPGMSVVHLQRMLLDR